MNKLSEKDLLKLHFETLRSMYGEARITDDEWNHAFSVLTNTLIRMEKMGFVNLDEFDFGEKSAHRSRYKSD